MGRMEPKSDCIDHRQLLRADHHRYCFQRASAASHLSQPIVFCIASIAVQEIVFADPSWADKLSTTQGLGLAFSFGTNALGLAALFTSLASNVLATSLIGLKAWYELLGSSLKRIDLILAFAGGIDNLLGAKRRSFGV